MSAMAEWAKSHLRLVIEETPDGKVVNLQVKERVSDSSLIRYHEHWHTISSVEV